MISKFNVLFLDKNNFPMVFNQFAINVSVCIGTTKDNAFCNARCDIKSVAHFSVKNFPKGKYYIRGAWKEGYVNFTKPLTIEVENDKITCEGKQITEDETLVIKANF